MIYGLDVSRWQGKMNWKKAWDNGARFAIVKASQGMSYKDPEFKRNIDGALEQGFAIGAYHYFENASDGEAQAENFKKATAGYDYDIEYSIDAEDPATTAKISVLTSNLQKQVLGFRGYQGFEMPMIYTRKSWFDARVLAWSYWSSCPLWVAHWEALTPVLPKFWKTWKIWQKGLESGPLWGAESRQIDVNVWNTTLDPFLGHKKDVVDLGNGYGAVVGEQKDPYEGAILTVGGQKYRLVKEQ